MLIACGSIDENLIIVFYGFYDFIIIIVLFVIFARVTYDRVQSKLYFIWVINGNCNIISINSFFKFAMYLVYVYNILDAGGI